MTPEPIDLLPEADAKRFAGALLSTNPQSSFEVDLPLSELAPVAKALRGLGVSVRLDSLRHRLTVTRL